MKKIHFIGIGGIGMSGLAYIHLAKGDTVSGSDLRLNNLTEELSRKGATIYQGHDMRNVTKDIDIVVKSACIKDNNPEVVHAENLGVPVVSRGEVLKKIMGKEVFSIAVTGTHGKTTTSALISYILERCGKDPTIVVGGEMDFFGGNAKLGYGDIMVAEVDESDGSFRSIDAECAVITNVEREHIEHYGSMENLIDAYKEFAGRIPGNGFFIFNGEDFILQSFLDTVGCRKVSYGIDKTCDITARNYSYDKLIEFDIVAYGADCGRITSPLIGRYNLMNILAASAVCIEMGLSTGQIADAVGMFKGVRRRFDLIGSIGGIKVIEDYAHHPTELNSVITAARNYTSGRVVTIFQPHRYSRTRDLIHEFSNCFYSSDVLVLTDIYSADEEINEDMEMKNIYTVLDESRFKEMAFLKKKDIPDFISEIVRDGDIILVLGAGDIRDISGEIVRKIEAKAGKAVMSDRR